MTTAWSVPRDWEGETVAILASGPSMTREQAEMVRGKVRVIAVNNQGIDTECNGAMVPAFAPWADVLYAADQKWWGCYKDRALKFAGLKVTLRSGLPFKEVLSLQQSSQRVFDPRPTHLASGGNSGYQAVHLAVHFGVKQIWLCGFDMVSTDKRRHWFGNHPPRVELAAELLRAGLWRSASSRRSCSRRASGCSTAVRKAPCAHFTRPIYGIWLRS